MKFDKELQIQLVVPQKHNFEVHQQLNSLGKMQIRIIKRKTGVLEKMFSYFSHYFSTYFVDKNV